MATDISLIFFDLAKQAKEAALSKDIVVLLQIGQTCVPHRINMLDSGIPTVAGDIHLDKIANECDEIRDVSVIQSDAKNFEQNVRKLEGLRDAYSHVVFDWIFENSDYLLDISAQAQGAKRLRICIPPDSVRLKRLPFELLEPSPISQRRFHWIPNAPLAVSDGWSLVRSLPMEFRDLTPSEINKLVVLVVAESPEDLDDFNLPPIDVKKEIEAIRGALDPITNVEMISKINASLIEVKRFIEQQEVHCLHFIGHGCRSIPSKGRPGLAFCGLNGKVQFADAGQFVTTVLGSGGGSKLRVVVLNACYSEVFSDDLTRKGVPAVVATQFPVTDQACKMFSEGFYGTLAKKGDIELAVLKGRQELYLNNSVQWASFALYLQASHGKLFQPDQLEVEWIHVPAGTYQAGSNRQKMEALLEKFGILDDRNLETILEPVSTRHLEEFWMTKYPVTNELYGKFVKDNPSKTPKHWPFAAHKGNHPVVGISWEDAQAFTAWIGCDLPTIEQWEKAARGPSDLRSYPWGDDFDATRCACADGGASGTSEVGQHSNGDSACGVSDMTGNVSEWMKDSRSDGYVACKGGAFGMTCEIFGLIHFTIWIQGGFAEDTRGFRLASQTKPQNLRIGSHMVVEET